MICKPPPALNLMMGVVLTLSLVTVSNAFAEYKDCAKVWVCVGTTANDVMRAGNVTDGNEGNDRIVAGTWYAGGRTFQGNDICGGAGDDTIVGDDNFQIIVGDKWSQLPNPVLCPSTRGLTGADRILAGGSDDIIFHGNLAFFASFGGLPSIDTADNKASDGKRDIIDCGAGNDYVVINTSVDHDVAVNCEQVFAG